MRRKRRLPPIETRIEMLRTHYGDKVKTREWSLRFAVIDCYFRYKLSIAETADVLGISQELVESAVDGARQDAR